MSGVLGSLNRWLSSNNYVWETYDYKKRMQEIYLRMREEEMLRIDADKAEAKRWMVSKCNDAVRHLQRGDEAYSASRRFDIGCKELHAIIDGIHQTNPSTRKILEKPYIEQSSDYVDPDNPDDCQTIYINS